MLSRFGHDAGVRLARKHVSWYSRGLPGSAEFRAAVTRLPDAAAGAAADRRFLRSADRARRRPPPRRAARRQHDRGGGMSSVCRARRACCLPRPPARRRPRRRARALPVPVVVLDPGEPLPPRQPRRRAIPRHVRRRSWHSCGLTDLVPPDSPLFLLIEQVRQTEATIANHDMTLESPRLRKRGITVHGSPLPEEPGAVLLVLQDASAARALDRQLAFRGAARSVTGMAAILAHEVKNPLSGIRGAAQLLEASVGPTPIANWPC